MAVSASPQVVSPEVAAKTSQRLVFLDVARGMTIAFMILVNNHGNEQATYWPLKHADWNGWTPTDLIFPIFLFLVGITSVLSTASRIARGESKSSLFWHALRRAVILFALGILIHGFPGYPLATLRIYGVLQRIAICYFVATVLYLWDRRVVTLVSVAVACLLGYWILMRWVPIPGFGAPVRDFPFMDKDLNWVAVVDRWLLPGRLLEKTRDPLGLISAIPAIATCIFGMLAGLWLRTARGMKEKAAGMLAGAVAGLVLGSVWAMWFPINKRLWTSSYVLFAAGWTLLILFICYVAIDIKKHQGAWTFPWKVFGSNAIFAYAFSELLSTVLGLIHIGSDSNAMSLKRLLYTSMMSIVGDPSFASLLYSLTFVLISFVACLVLYRRRIFFKI